MQHTTRHLQIGELADACGTSRDTIRYYERAGLLPPPHRRGSGYRDYDASAVRRLRFIRSAKDLGFSLDDIRDLLALSVDREHGVKGVKQRALARVAVVEERLEQLGRMRDGLRELIDACPGEGHLEGCPILRALCGEGDGKPA